MFRYQIGYRHKNGEVEGFSATAFSVNSAKQRAIRLIRNKLHDAFNPPQELEPKRLLISRDQVTADEWEQLKADWKLLACLNKE